MRKEAIFAIISGILFGLFIAFGVFRLNKTFKQNDSLPEDIAEENTQAKSNGNTQESQTISLVKPSENDVITVAKTEISGITKPNLNVVISAEVKDYILKSDSKGEFKQEIDLEGGLNQIIILAMEEDGSEFQKNINVIYSTEFAKD